jgi:hypothetical protein
MATTVKTTRTLVLPDMSDRYSNNNPPDGYVVTFSAGDGYYLAKPLSRILSFSSPSISPYNIVLEDAVLVQTHVGIFTVNLPPITSIAVASNGASLPQAIINVASTTGFPSSGTLFVTTNTGIQTVTYTNTSGGNQFTGCAGGNGLMSTGGLVTNTTPPTAGYSVYVKDFAGVAAGNQINIVSSILIDGASPYSITNNYGSIRVFYNGSTWSVIAKV